MARRPTDGTRRRTTPHAPWRAHVSAGTLPRRAPVPAPGFQHLGVLEEGVERLRACGEIAGPAIEAVALAEIQPGERERRVQQLAQGQARRTLRPLVFHQA